MNEEKACSFIHTNPMVRASKFCATIDGNKSSLHNKRLDRLVMESSMHTWQLQEAKSRFSEVVDFTLSEGPQMVTRRGQDAVVILSVGDYRRLSGSSPLLGLLLNAPRGEPLNVARSREAIREIQL